MMNSTEQLVIERAKQLSSEMISLKGAKPPFTARYYADLLGVKEIVSEDLGLIDGMLIKNSESPLIKLNSKHNYYRQNFSLAHELGHLMLDEISSNKDYCDIEFRSETKSNNIERLCNVIATEMLMPQEIFVKYLSNIGGSIYSVAHLSQIFGVSLQSTIIRMAELSDTLMVALCWKHFKTNKRQFLKLAWNTTSNRVENGYRYKPTKIIVGSNEALFRAITTDDVVKNFKEFNLANLKKKCPMESKGFGYGNNRCVLSLAFI